MLSRQREPWKVFEQQPQDKVFEPTPNPLQFLEARPDRHQGCTIKGDTEKGGGIHGNTRWAAWWDNQRDGPNQLNINDLDECQAGRRCFVET